MCLACVINRDGFSGCPSIVDENLKESYFRSSLGVAGLMVGICVVATTFCTVREHVPVDFLTSNRVGMLTRDALEFIVALYGYYRSKA